MVKTCSVCKTTRPADEITDLVCKRCKKMTEMKKLKFWWKDNRENLVAAANAIQRYDQHREINITMVEVRQALGYLGTKTRNLVCNQLHKLILANNIPRAIKLLGAVGGVHLQWWLLWPLIIISWPFVLIWRIIKLGLP